jgi:prepilin-type N-terminal cleavage/methylation domain-containing protein
VNRALFSGSRGFTLVESIMVLVALSIAAAAIVSLQGNIFGNQANKQNIQIGVQLMQECAEQVLAKRRLSGYSSITTSNFGTNLCGGMTAFVTSDSPPVTYAIPSVTFITDPYSGSGCPPNGTCKLLSIAQSNLTPITLLLVSYQ